MLLKYSGIFDGIQAGSEESDAEAFVFSPCINAGVLAKEDVMILPDDWVTKTGNDLRKMEKELQYVLRLLHEHKRALEVAVEGKYANQMSDPRVRLLGDALYVSHL